MLSTDSCISSPTCRGLLAIFVFSKCQAVRIKLDLIRSESFNPECSANATWRNKHMFRQEAPPRLSCSFTTYPLSIPACWSTAAFLALLATARSPFAATPPSVAPDAWTSCTESGWWWGTSAGSESSLNAPQQEETVTWWWETQQFNQETRISEIIEEEKN